MAEIMAGSAGLKEEFTYLIFNFLEIYKLKMKFSKPSISQEAGQK